MISKVRKTKSIVEFKKAMLITFLLFAPSISTSQDMTSIPEGQGKELVSTQCAACHGLSTVLVKRATNDEWNATVSRMVSTYMAPINEKDKTVIVDYLSTNFGKDSNYNPGQRLLAEQCFRCHADGMWKDLKTDRTGWLSVIYRMVGRGGKWTPEQINLLADYLAESYPVGARK